MIKKQISNISFQLLEIDRNQFGEYEAQAKDAIIEIAKNIGRNDLNMLEHLFIIK